MAKISEVLAALCVVIVFLLLLPFIMVVLLYEKIKFIGKPKECCRAGCFGCPWGDITCIGYRKRYKDFKQRNPDYNNRPNYKLK